MREDGITYIYALTDLHATLASVPALGAVIVALVETICAAAGGERVWSGPRKILLAWALGPALMAAAWALGFLPAAVGWREALALGITAAIESNGFASVAKARYGRRHAARD